jgi:hypothetical protein
LFAWSRRLDWALMMKRTFGFDVLVCRSRSGKMRVIATITEPPVVRRLLEPLAVLPRPLELLFDGMAAAERREQGRAWEARRAGMFVVAAAAIVEVLLLILRNRSAQKTLEAHLVEAWAEGMSAEDKRKVLKSGRDYPLLRALVAAAVLALAFAIIAALGTLRWRWV